MSTDVPVKLNSDLAKALVASRNDLAICNNDKKALRTWAKE